MAERLLITKEDFTAIASNAQQIIDILGTEYATMDSGIDVLSNDWTGGSKDSFTTAGDNARSHLYGNIVKLMELRENIERVALKIEEADQVTATAAASAVQR